MEQTGLIVARGLVYATLLPATGLPLYLALTGQDDSATLRARRLAALLAVLAMLASAWWLAQSVAAMAALPLGDLDLPTIIAVAEATPLAAALKVRIAALAVLAITLPSRLPLAIPLLAGIAALASAAFTGHAGAGTALAGLAHRAADTAHLAAAAGWLGALLLFVGTAFGAEPAETLEQRLARFARTGTIAVAVLLASGIANTLLIADWPLTATSRWTMLLFFKTILFAAMLGLAAMNRWWLTPALGCDMPSARIRLRISLVAELACGAAVIGIVAVLGTTDPAAG